MIFPKHHSHETFLSTLFSLFGLSTVLFKREKPILGTIIVTDKCNLACRHCAVNNLTGIMHPWDQLVDEMKTLYGMGIRILFLCGGETFLWTSGDKTLRDLVLKAKKMGFRIVNVVTNGTFPLDLPEADLILLSLDGSQATHDTIRGRTYDRILGNIRQASSSNICLYMAINQLNKHAIAEACRTAKEEANIRAISFNFHTPYPGTEELSLSKDEKKACCRTIEDMMNRGYPVFNLRSAFPYLIHNDFPTPCRQCVVMENGNISICGRCVDEQDLCKKCGYFFAAEYALVFQGNIPVIRDMLSTYLRYI